MSGTDWTAADMLDAQRTSIAMALAAWRHDGDGIGALWSGSPNREALLHLLCRLPSVMIRLVSEREGYTIDPDELLEDLLHNLPLDPDPEED